ncbi:MAG TPA: hypothetical protein PLJ27_07635 [Polyangiaceae bacterium]|nr:MAG: hypothetical protein BWY17_04012 [Deltaproteobacteria bacterium ADurb.Bin207]HNS95677.1 hypothetical protein [Polyangiaceae bacterium]HNZ25321.1 hypothetical protein [Polyangiaceae bacterium]HOD24933.1 hypothetical protein [Polyangiaceae bacterium]HOE50392.1 hypothetical protein [Polyangiaceae bacterium]
MRLRPNAVLTVILASCTLSLVAPRTAEAEPIVSHDPMTWVFPWDKTVGRIIGQEADSEGPKSFVIKPDGGALILDQVNCRVLDTDPKGNLIQTLALPAPTFDDIELVNENVMVLADRLVSKTLLLMDLQGHPLQQIEIQGRGITHSGLVTAMIARTDGVWLEVEHRHSVKVLDRALQPCERQIITGRPVANGWNLQGKLDGRGEAIVSIGRRIHRETMRSVSLKGQLPIRRIVWLDMDAKGQVHVVLHEAQFATESPYPVQKEQYAWVVLDESLQEISRTISPWVLTLYDQRVECRLGPDGRMWQMAFDTNGVRLIDWGRGTP